MPLDQLTKVIKDAFNGTAKKKKFSDCLHRDNDSALEHTETHQFHADVPLRAFLREPLPPELPEGVQLGGLQ